jgi:hypothetical protein
MAKRGPNGTGEIRRNVSLTQEDYDISRDAAASEGLAWSEWVRQAIHRAVLNWRHRQRQEK